MPAFHPVKNEPGIFSFSIRNRRVIQSEHEFDLIIFSDQMTPDHIMGFWKTGHIVTTLLKIAAR
jgi:hypothetical protein